jgi:hypothetical protein
MFQIFLPGGESISQYYSELACLFLELLIIYLATEHDFFRKLVTKMLFTIFIFFALLYAASYLKVDEYLGDDFLFLTTHSKPHFIYSIWHFIAYSIAVITNHFYKNKFINNKIKEH